MKVMADFLTSQDIASISFGSNAPADTNGRMRPIIQLLSYWDASWFGISITNESAHIWSRSLSFSAHLAAGDTCHYTATDIRAGFS